MTPIYRVKSPVPVHHSSPLHVDRFYPDLARKHYRITQDRQELILYLASIHSRAVKLKQPLSFCRIPMRLTSLREWVYNYRVVLDYFFDVAELGYSLEDKSELTILTPKKLPVIEQPLQYVVPELPAEGTISKVYVNQAQGDEILHQLGVTGRLDLALPVEWLLSQPEVNFWFVPAGKLQQRDTSIWPVAAVETWPSWLRESLFGAGIDIESAYTQYLLSKLRDAYGSESTLKLLYPDLIRSLEDKSQWRREICCDVLGLEENEKSLSVVKRICMSLANGSRISPAILIGAFGHSVTKDIILKETEEMSIASLEQIGTRLSRISSQYSSARKQVCTAELKLQPSRLNQKQVFRSYFEWEREARYQIWEAVGRHGIMVHDGIDGVPEQYTQDIPGLVRSLDLRITKS